ncbi:MAG TPA: DNA-3-methyladenine glycosylase [Candidatus Obscuribacterales bacterium]
MTPITTRDFLSRPTVEVARGLLGVQLVRRHESGLILRAPIVEVEAYTEDDPACHAFRGETDRCRAMFGPPGHAYVYFIYGMYFCLNVVTEPKGKPGAVLIRAIGSENTNGPGKLCREWQINRSHNGLDLLDMKNGELWLEPGTVYGDDEVVVTPRIGINVATERMWRFFVKDHPSVSGGKISTPRSKRSRLKRTAMS